MTKSLRPVAVPPIREALGAFRLTHLHLCSRVYVTVRVCEPVCLSSGSSNHVL